MDLSVLKGFYSLEDAIDWCNRSGLEDLYIETANNLKSLNVDSGFYYYVIKNWNKDLSSGLASGKDESLKLAHKLTKDRSPRIINPAGYVNTINASREIGVESPDAYGGKRTFTKEGASSRRRRIKKLVQEAIKRGARDYIGQSNKEGIYAFDPETKHGMMNELYRRVAPTESEKKEYQMAENRYIGNYPGSDAAERIKEFENKPIGGKGRASSFAKKLSMSDPLSIDKAGDLTDTGMPYAIQPVNNINTSGVARLFNVNSPSDSANPAKRASRLDRIFREAVGRAVNEAFGSQDEININNEDNKSLAELARITGEESNTPVHDVVNRGSEEDVAFATAGSRDMERGNEAENIKLYGKGGKGTNGDFQRVVDGGVIGGTSLDT